MILMKALIPTEIAKGRKDRYVFFSTIMQGILRKWIDYKERDFDTEYVFISTRDSNFNVMNFEKNLKIKLCISLKILQVNYNVQFWVSEDDRTPFTLLCDEAHLYLPVRENADSVEAQALYNFERIAKKGRKYGVLLLVVSQRPSDVSKTILSQCNNFIILRLTNDRDQSVVKSLIPDSLKGVVECLPILDGGEVIVLGDCILLPNRIKIAEPNIKPQSNTKNFWTEWN